LKIKYFINSILLPRVVIGNWATGLIVSIPIAFPNCQFQGYDWYAVQAITKWYYRENYTSEKIDGNNKIL